VNHVVRTCDFTARLSDVPDGIFLHLANNVDASVIEEEEDEGIHHTFSWPGPLDPSFYSDGFWIVTRSRHFVIVQTFSGLRYHRSSKYLSSRLEL